MDNKKIWSSIAIIITVILWGLSFISIKVTVDVLPPMTLALSRFLIASVILTLVIKMKEPKTKLNKKDIPMMAIAGFIGVTLYFFFENNGIKLTTASTASLLIATIPIFSLIAEAIVFKTRLTALKVIGVIVSVAGVYFIVGGNLGKIEASGSFNGYLMMLGAVLSWVIYSILTKPLFKKYSQLAIVYYQTIFGTIFLIPFVVVETTNWSMVSSSIVLNVVYLGVFCSAVGYYLYVKALDYLGVTTSSLYLNIIPLVTVVGSYFILKESINSNQIIGGILVVASVYIVNWKGSTKKVDKVQRETIKP